jgi:hypothetical protein
MTESVQRYALRLTARYFFYDPDHGVHVSRQFAAGAIVTDPDAIRFLEDHDAPVERIAADKHTQTRS